MKKSVIIFIIFTVIAFAFTGIGEAQIIDLVGDNDNFTPGDVADIPRQSQCVIDILDAIDAGGGFDPAVNLDVMGANRPVGLTHAFALPANALITAATINLRLKVTDALAYNDAIIYDESIQTGIGEPFLPFIALIDLLGFDPKVGQTYNVAINLNNVPIRTRDTSGGPGGDYTPNPEEFRNLIPLLYDGEFNLVILDDVAVDYSKLTLNYVQITSDHIENKKARLTFFYNQFFAKDRLSIVGYLQPQLIAMPFGQDVTVTVTAPDPLIPGNILVLFTKTVPANTVSGTKKYRFRSGDPGIQELLFDQRSDSTYFYVKVDEVDFLPCQRLGIMPPVAYLAFIQAIPSYTITIQIDNTNVWSGTAPLLLGTLTGQKQELNFWW